mmetsp:Transcript_6217/g.14160  ORF Transcript_6217/g.14160 Transcript_6217/m.14160 type:complete len:1594 (+) Transcript_6217:40-4821(+)
MASSDGMYSFSECWDSNLSFQKSVDVSDPKQERKARNVKEVLTNVGRALQADECVARERRMWTVLLGVGCTTTVIWAIALGASGSFSVCSDFWVSMCTMIAGSFVAGSTPYGGGSVAFPVNTIALGLSPTFARDFALLIQSVGMNAAAVCLLSGGVEMELTALVFTSAGGLGGIVLGLVWIAPVLSASTVKLFFTSLWMAFAVALFTGYGFNGNVEHNVSKINRRHRTLLGLIVLGCFGGIISSLVGAGIDTLVFAVLTLVMRLDAKKAQLTSVAIMGINASFGAAARCAFAFDDMDPNVFKAFAACIPVCVFGAPLGAVVAARSSAKVMMAACYIAAVIQFVAGIMIVAGSSEALFMFALMVLFVGGMLFNLLQAWAHNSAELAKTTEKQGPAEKTFQMSQHSLTFKNLELEEKFRTKFFHRRSVSTSLFGTLVAFCISMVLRLWSVTDHVAGNTCASVLCIVVMVLLGMGSRQKNTRELYLAAMLVVFHSVLLLVMVMEQEAHGLECFPLFVLIMVIVIGPSILLVRFVASLWMLPPCLFMEWVAIAVFTKDVGTQWSQALTLIVAHALSIASQFNIELSARQNFALELEETSRRDAVISAEAQKASMEKFLRCTSHDMRTPLQAIMHATFVLSKLIGDHDEANSLLSIITSSSSIVDLIISNVLDLQKVESGCVKPVPVPFDIPEGIAKMTRVLSNSTSQRSGVKVIADVDDAMPVVMCDGPRLIRTMLNLVSNSLKFTRVGHVKIAVRIVSLLPAVGPQAPKCTLEFTVTDTGCGMTPEELEQACELYVHSAGSGGGSGLGLFICRSYVQAFGGELHLESTPGAGTRINFTLTFDVAPHSARSQTDEEDMSTDGRVPMRVLLVDDNPVNREAGITALQLLGHHPDSASNGQAALDVLCRSGPRKYDVVLMDMDMPLLRGDKAAAEYRKWEARNNPDLVPLRIIALTGNVTEADRQQALAAGCDDFFTKPIQPLSIERLMLQATQFLSPHRTVLSPHPRSLEAPICIASSTQAIGNTCPNTQLFVLFVDDHETNRRMGLSVLQALGHEVEVAADGKEALKRLTTSDTFDLAFIDMQMPVMTGTECTSSLRKWELSRGQSRSTYICILTGNQSEEDRAACMEAGANAFLSKPVDPSELEIVCQTARRHRLRVASNNFDQLPSQLAKPQKDAPLPKDDEVEQSALPTRPRQLSQTLNVALEQLGDPAFSSTDSSASAGGIHRKRRPQPLSPESLPSVRGTQSLLNHKVWPEGQSSASAPAYAAGVAHPGDDLVPPSAAESPKDAIRAKLEEMRAARAARSRPLTPSCTPLWSNSSQPSTGLPSPDGFSAALQKSFDNWLIPPFSTTPELNSSLEPPTPDVRPAAGVFPDSEPEQPRSALDTFNPDSLTESTASSPDRHSRPASSRPTSRGDSGGHSPTPRGPHSPRSLAAPRWKSGSVCSSLGVEATSPSVDECESPVARDSTARLLHEAISVCAAQQQLAGPPPDGEKPLFASLGPGLPLPRVSDCSPRAMSGGSSPRRQYPPYASPNYASPSNRSQSASVLPSSSLLPITAGSGVVDYEAGHPFLGLNKSLMANASPRSAATTRAARNDV